MEINERQKKIIYEKENEECFKCAKLDQENKKLLKGME